MRKVTVLLVAIALGLTTAVSAKKLPAIAAKLPADFKQEITKHIDYPKFAQNNLIEGEVWMKQLREEAKQSDDLEKIQIRARQYRIKEQKKVLAVLTNRQQQKWIKPDVF